MERIDDRIVLSASDLTNHLACTRLTALELAALGNRNARPAPADAADAEVIRRRGEEHEALYLKQLRNDGRQVVELDRPEPGLAGLAAGEAATVAAMAAGAEVIYQGTLFDGTWRGHPDFLFRVDERSGRWPWSYEVCDAKLARRVKAAAILQTCAYSDHVERIQGSPPKQIHVVGGDFTTRSYRLADYAAYYRQTKAALEGIVGAAPDDTYIWPVEHCQVCPWAQVCDTQRRSQDHLSLVAGIRQTQARRLGAAGISTLTALAARPAGPVPKLAAPVAQRLGAQARLQLDQRRNGDVTYELLDHLDDGSGLSLLPAPSAGDIFFDMEGDPFVADDGLEYLFGFTTVDAAGQPVFQPVWAHDKTAEKTAFETFVDFVVARQQAYPDLHVYHYAPYEPSALKRLMGAHATRELEIDAFLRGGVFVDLYTVVRQAIRVSQESYGLKALEALYMGKRHGAITSATSSIVAYEQWLLDGDPRILDEIADYNRLDCESTWRLREWLEDRRLEAAGNGVVLTRPDPRAAEASETQAAAEASTAALVARLTAGVPDDPAARSRTQRATWLLAQLLDWHRREARPEWWAHYARLVMPPDELLDDAEAMAGLAYDGVVAQVKQSLVHRYRFPSDQEHKILLGATVFDPATGKAAGTVEGVEATAGIVDLKRGRNSTAPHPGAVIPGPPFNDQVLRDALGRVGEWVADHGIDADGPYRAVRDLLLHAHPRIAGERAGAALVGPGEPPAAALRRLAVALDGGCLAVQGPPGTGKTWSGARTIVDLVGAGKRVGITATSHKAIGNLFAEVCAAADSAGVTLRALQKAADEADRCASPAVECVPDNATVEARVAAGTVDVVAGTPWLFARDALAGTFDVLIVDEAGQMSLANLVAVGGAATNIVLLGDPQQLAQPSKGTHPAGAGRSALEHVLDGHPTIPPERGVLLDVTWRMHPDVCGFVSDAFYESRLHSAPSCAGQRVEPGDWAGGTGLRWIPVEHVANKVSSPEEAAEVAAGVAALLGRDWVDEEGRRRRLGLDDILVVAPCNAHVATLRGVLPAGARVGTVDKFQGQQAAVVVFSMAASSADDVPRNLEFLFSLNRLNVAISRARALAILVCSPELFRVRCRTPQQMRLVNALCLLAEHAHDTGDQSEPAPDPMAAP